MSTIFNIDNVQDFSENLNIDELYEKKRLHDLNQLNLFNKILNRIHVRIKLTSKQRMNEQFCWYVVPETILGVPKYDQAACIAYLINTLSKNKFVVKYVDPNALFISWRHWVPSYVRTEIKKKTGVIVNEFGNVVEEKKDENDPDYEEPDYSDPNSYMTQQKDGSQLKKPKKEYNSVKSYKPSGNLVYDEDLLNKLEDKISFK